MYHQTLIMVGFYDKGICNRREGGIDWVGCSLTSSITDKVPLTTTPNATLSNATSEDNKTT